MYDLTVLSDEEFEEHRLHVLNEQERRQRLADAPAQAAEIVRRYAEDGGNVTTLIEAITPQE